MITDKAQIKIVELIESDLKLPDDATFTRSSVAYLSDGTQVAANTPRFEQGKFGKAIMLEEGTENLLNNPLFNTTDSWQLLTDGGGIFTAENNWGKLTKGTGTYAYVRQTINRSGISGDKYYFQIKFKNNIVGQVSIRAGCMKTSETRNTLTLDGTGGYVEAFVMHTATESYTQVWVDIVIGTYYGHSHPAEFVEFSFAQLEKKPYATSFIDGTRSPESLTIPTAGVLSPQEGTWEHWIYVNDVSKRQVPSQYPCLFNILRTGGGNGILVWYSPISPNWALETRDDNNQKTTATISDSYTPNGWHLFTVTWKNEEAVLYIDGIRRGTISNPHLPSGFTSAYIGGHNPASYLNTLHDSVRISSRARTDEEILAAYQSGKPLPVDEWTTYKLDFDDKVRITTQGQIICNELIEI